LANHFHEASRRRWDAGSAFWARRADTRGIWRKCHRDPSLALHSAELEWFCNIAGKSVAVLGSGDNQVVLALAGMGAAPLSAKRLLALWNALPGVEKRKKVGDRDSLIDQLWSAIEALLDPEPQPDPKPPSK
jgi:hypothetical protein